MGHTSVMLITSRQPTTNNNREEVGTVTHYDFPYPLAQPGDTYVTLDGFTISVRENGELGMPLAAARKKSAEHAARTGERTSIIDNGDGTWDWDTVDTSSSASRQHYIDTGRYLRSSEVEGA